LYCSSDTLPAEMLNGDVEDKQQELLDRHYLRKHGKNAYYGHG